MYLKNQGPILVFVYCSISAHEEDSLEGPGAGSLCPDPGAISSCSFLLKVS